MSHLPSLQTLRAFVAAGRHKSYSKAAEELGLTHGAVSHRIRELEERLGVPLFKRVGNSMQLTEAGQKLEAQVRQGLSLLEQAFAPAKNATSASKPRRHIVVTSVPSLGSDVALRAPWRISSRAPRHRHRSARLGDAE